MVNIIETIELTGNDYEEVRDAFNKDVEEKEKAGYRVQHWSTYVGVGEVVMKYVAEKNVY